MLELDKEYRSLITNVNELRSERNTVSKKIAYLKKDGQSAETEIAQMKEVGNQFQILKKNQIKLKN